MEGSHHLIKSSEFDIISDSAEGPSGQLSHCAADCALRRGLRAGQPRQRGRGAAVWLLAARAHQEKRCKGHSAHQSIQASVAD